MFRLPSYLDRSALSRSSAWINGTNLTPIRLSLRKDVFPLDQDEFLGVDADGNDHPARTASWVSSAVGHGAAAAVTRMASKGPASGQPRDPSPTRKWTFA